MPHLKGEGSQAVSGICWVLSWEHERILQASSRVIQAGGTPENARIRRMFFESMRDELIVHSRAEEAVLYPEARRLDPIRSFLTYSRREHDELEAMLRELGRLNAGHWKWDMKFRHFAVELEYHIQDEEEELFPRIQRSFTRARQLEMEWEYWMRRRRLENRFLESHPDRSSGEDKRAA